MDNKTTKQNAVTNNPTSSNSLSSILSSSSSIDTAVKEDSLDSKSRQKKTFGKFSSLVIDEETKRDVVNYLSF